jgi:hypothetical protein
MKIWLGQPPDCIADVAMSQPGVRQAGIRIGLTDTCIEDTA